MLQALELSTERECERIIEFIQSEFGRAGFSRAVLGLSGGIDSALVAALAAQALGADHVHVMMLPYCNSNPDSDAHARLMVDRWGFSCERFEITPVVEPFFARDPQIDDRRKGNIMSRCRMVALYDLSAAVGGLVLGTSNRTETLLGYFTLHGDGAAAIKPIAHLFKCQVRALSRHVGIPQAIIEKAPSADLWAGQTDEGDLGFTYDEADQILYLLTEEHLGKSQIAALGFDARVVSAVKARLEVTAFKRLPPPVLPPNNLQRKTT
jgi:NAD+ synthase